MNQTRQPAGVPVGGQFATHTRDDADVTLDISELPADGHFQSARSLTWAADNLRDRAGVLALTAALREHGVAQAILEWNDGAAYDGGSRLGISSLLDANGDEIEVDTDDITTLEGYIEEIDYDGAKSQFDSDDDDFDKFNFPVGAKPEDPAPTAIRTLEDIGELRAKLAELEFDIAADATRDIVHAAYPNATEVWFEKYDVGSVPVLNPVAIQSADDDELWAYNPEADAEGPTIRDRLSTVAGGLTAARDRMALDKHPEWERYSLTL